MELTARLNTVAARFSVWTVQNPTATRVFMIALPLVLAALAALANQQPVYACPTQSGCIGGD
jgi:hypothetical protein